MKAMILAAGIGSRLQPVTNTIPKALIEVGGVPMLEIVLTRLVRAGCTAVVINLFHLAGMVIDFLKSKSNFGIQIEVSRETELLDTGGGLKKVADFFDDDQPFLLHNVDVLTNLDLRRLIQFHSDNHALATLAVQSRASSRYLLFDEGGNLCGWQSVAEDRTLWCRSPVNITERLAFNGIHVISPKIFNRMSEAGKFSINHVYLRLAGEGERIQAFRADGFFWRDIGRLDRLESVRREIAEIGLPA